MDLHHASTREPRDSPARAESRDTPARAGPTLLDIKTPATVAGGFSLALLVVSAIAPATLAPRFSTGVVVAAVGWVAGIGVSLARSRRGDRHGKSKTSDPRSERRKPPSWRPWKPKRKKKASSSGSNGHGPIVPISDDQRRVITSADRSPRIRTAREARRLGAKRVVSLAGDRWAAARQLADWLTVDQQRPIVVAIAAAGSHRAAAGWGLEVADVLAGQDRRVLYLDLEETAGRQRRGLDEVASGSASLSAVLEDHPDLPIYRVVPGRDHRAAAAELGKVIERLPDRFDAVVVALPRTGSASVPIAAEALGRVTLVGVRGWTRIPSVRAALGSIPPGVETSFALVSEDVASEGPTGWPVPVADEPEQPHVADRMPPEPVTVTPTAAPAEIWGTEASGQVPSEPPVERIRPEDVWGRVEEAREPQQPPPPAAAEPTAPPKTAPAAPHADGNGNGDASDLDPEARIIEALLELRRGGDGVDPVPSREQLRDVGDVGSDDA